MLNFNECRGRRDFMTEEWKPITDWEELYEISNFGRVRNKKTGKLLVGDVNNCGYHRVRLYNGGNRKRYFRHRLVATHFICNDDVENKRFVNHIDGDKSNNTTLNLEWVTQSDNEKHAFKTGLKSKTNRTFRVEFNDGRIEVFNDQYTFANVLGVSQSLIHNWLHDKQEGYKLHEIVKIYFI